MGLNFFKKNKDNCKDYSCWISEIEKSTFVALDNTNHPLQDEDFPMFSVVLIDKSESYSDDVMSTISSLVHQKNTNWELLFVSNASSEYPLCANDQRIKYILPVKGDDYFELVNFAVSACTGAFVLFLRAGDQLSPHAIRLLSAHCVQMPEIQLIVTDEDFFDESGLRCCPNFKPDWNPDYLLSFNYFSRAVVFKKTLFQSLDGFDGSLSDPHHALVLGATQRLDAKEIAHIDAILFHLMPVKSLSINESHIVHRESYALPSPLPLVSIIIPTKDQLALLKNCIDGLLSKTKYQQFEIIVIDNQSEQQETKVYLLEIARHPQIRVMAYDKPFNYSEMNNQAAAEAKGEILAFLNNDVSVLDDAEDDWLTEMVSHVCRPEIGCVGAKLFYPDGTIQHAGVILGLKGYASHAHKGFSRDSAGYMNRLIVTHNVSAVTAACMLVKKEVFEEVNGFDAKNLKVAYNDVDLCLKVRQAGYRNLFTPHAQLIHHESKSRGKTRNKKQSKELRKEAEYLRKKWANELFCDPAYNRNLTLSREDFSLSNHSDAKCR